MHRFVAVALCAVLPALAHAGPADPLRSPLWPDIAQKHFSTGTVVFDDRVKVVVPSVVENQAQVPVAADARALGDVVKLVVVADLNPIQHVLTLSPGRAEPYISFRMKVEQGTPVRAAALTRDGTWHVGGAYLDASGGGCTAPALARAEADWSETVGQAQGKVWRQADGLLRVRVRFRHPMDTGLAKDNTPAFFIERLEMRSSGSQLLASVEMFEPVSEDPMLTLLTRLPASERAVVIDGRDNNGHLYAATIPTQSKESAMRGSLVQ